MDIKTDLNLESTFTLIQEIKKGIKQKCYITITDADVDISGIGLRITIQTKNYRTKESMYFQKTIIREELIHTIGGLHFNIIKKTIDEANYYFKEEQTKNVYGR